MKLTLGFSPCPNDTFIFDALIHKKIDTEGLDFELSLDDVETLNQKAFGQQLDITKLSFHAFAHVLNGYTLLNAGSALGFGVGPIIICKNEQLAGRVNDLPQGLKIGIPGKYTTANFLLSIAFPKLLNKEEMVFSAIEPALLNEHIDLGLIIHENRFTYEEKGLFKVIDLGEYWEKRTGCPIPLGGIAIRRDLDHEVQVTVNRLIRKSVEFAFQNRQSALPFIRSHAQEMSETVMYKHIDLYVNKYSVDLGVEGKRAVETLFNLGLERKVIESFDGSLFID